MRAVGLALAPPVRRNRCRPIRAGRRRDRAARYRSMRGIKHRMDEPGVGIVRDRHLRNGDHKSSSQMDFLDGEQAFQGQKPIASIVVLFDVASTHGRRVRPFGQEIPFHRSVVYVY